MKKKIEKNEGITLVALVITMIIMLILVGVTLNITLDENGIIARTKEAKTKYEDAAKLESMEMHADRGGIAPIPTGYVVSQAAGENKISTGLVIYEGTDPVTDSNVEDAKKTRNQFVWIPVPNINEMVKLQSGSTTNYEGKLYDFNDTTGVATEKSNYGINTNFEREPSGTEDYDLSESYITQFGLKSGDTITDVNKVLQTEFNNMIASVSKYGGFFVGRYETSGFDYNTNVAISRKEQETGSINLASWYRMYYISKTLTDNSVTSSMIWGCQWDQVMKTVNGKKDGNGNIYIVGKESDVRHQQGDLKTGNNINDKVYNIYDLEGNVKEWTQEVERTNCKVLRGGDSSATLAASHGYLYNPTIESGNIGSRLALYIK